MKKHDFSNISLGLETSPSMANHIQDGMLERVTTLLKGLTGSTASLLIIEGCIVTLVSGTYTVTAGVVYYGGELLTVDAFTDVTSSGTVPVFKAVVDDYTGEPQAYFGDRVFRDVLGSRKMTIEMGAPSSGIVDCEDARNITNILRNDWQFTTVSTGINFITPSAITLLQYKMNYKDLGDDIIIQFYIIFSTASTGAFTALIPLPIPGVYHREEFGSCTIDCSTAGKSVSARVERSTVISANQLTISCYESITGQCTISGEFRYKKG